MDVLAINGEPLAGILRRILPNLPHDGDILTNRMRILGFNRGFHRTGFRESYRLYIGNSATFKTALRDPHTQKTVVVELAGVTNAEAAVNADLSSPSLLRRAAEPLSDLSDGHRALILMEDCLDWPFDRRCHIVNALPISISSEESR